MKGTYTPCRLPRVRHIELLILIYFAVQALFAQTWIQTTAPSTNWISVACSADGTKLVAAVGGWKAYYYDPLPAGPLFVSTNSGATWTTTTAPITARGAAASSAGGLRLAAAGIILGSPIEISTDSGDSWFTSGAPLTNAWIALASSADGHILMGSAPGGGHVPGAVLTSTDSGANWVWSLHDFTQWPSIACAANGRVMAASSWYGLYTSTNFGGSWDVTTNVEFFGPVQVSLSATGDQLIAATAGGGIYSSTNLGATWVATSAPATNWVAIACSGDAKTIVAGCGSRETPGITGPLYFSTNAVATWSPANTPIANWTSVCSSADGSKLFAASSVGGIYTWQTTPAPKIALTKLGSELMLSWLTPSVMFQLEQTTNIQTASWTQAGPAPTLNLTNLQQQVVFPQPSGAMFYRLRAP